MPDENPGRQQRALPRKTKIIATLGPATDEPGVLDAMVEAGLNVARLNCSHGTHDEHKARAAALREAARKSGHAVPILVDIQGPKLRVGDLPAHRDLADGSIVALVADGRVMENGVDAGFGEIPLSFDVLNVGVKPGDRLMFDDGRIVMTAVELTDRCLLARVEQGGPLGSKKGVNLPDTDTSIPALSDKDRRDLELAAEISADWVAVSFVSEAADLEAVRALVSDDVGLIAKIERPQAVGNFTEIALAADAVMIARGDLGVETPLHALPMLQKDLIERANALGVPAVTATEMMDSMTRSHRPTRAEVTDVANAVMDGTDAVMLSGETAVGVDPAGAVAAMASVVLSAETSDHYERRHAIGHRFLGNEVPTTAAVAAAATEIARDLGLSSIAVFTETGRTARIVAQTRPRARVVAFAHSLSTWRRLALYWGVVPVLIDRFDTTEQMVASASQALREAGIAVPGEKVVFVAGPPNRPGAVNFLHVCEV